MLTLLFIPFYILILYCTLIYNRKSSNKNVHNNNINNKMTTSSISDDSNTVYSLPVSFNGKNININDFIDELNDYIVLNDITCQNKQQDILISLLDSQAYDFIQRYIKQNNNNVTYHKPIDILQKRYNSNNIANNIVTVNGHSYNTNSYDTSSSSSNSNGSSSPVSKDNNITGDKIVKQ